MFLRYVQLAFLQNHSLHFQIGQIPLLDRLFLKNPIYLKLSQWGLVDSTFPVVKFARARMAERYPADADAEKSGTDLPTTEPKSADVSQPDLLSRFIQASKERPEFMTEARVMTMAVSMAFAGSETTAISLSSIFYFLLKNPRCMEKLVAELDEKTKQGYFENTDSGLVTWTESQGLPYLDACVKEAFRVHPAPGLPLERIVPPQGAEIAGHFVKGGTIVGCNAWVIHRRKEIFGEDVEAFRPERWLIDENKDKEEEEKRLKEMGGCMLQFGMGARTCIGKNISLLEIYKVVPSLVRRFEVCLHSGDIDRC